MSYLRIFILGFAESGGGVGLTFNNDPNCAKSRMYDYGRNLGDWFAGRPK